MLKKKNIWLASFFFPLLYFLFLFFYTFLSTHYFFGWTKNRKRGGSVTFPLLENILKQPLMFLHYLSSPRSHTEEKRKKKENLFFSFC